MAGRYAAFISYAHRYREWVAVLQRNLEACLGSDVFLDQTDLASGRSWVAQLQEGLAKSDQLILVATPEALASPRAADEYEGFVAARRGWSRGLFHVVTLVDVPLPPFIDRIHRLDFVEHDEDQYRRELRKLVGGILGDRARELPELPTGLEIPPPPGDTLPAELRRRLVRWLAPQVERKLLRKAVATALGISPALLEGHATPELTSSAALVAATGDDDRVQAARHVVRALRDAFDEEDDNDLAELDALKAELSRLGGDGDSGLLDAWLRRVRDDHSSLVPFFEHADLELLDRVYIRFGLRLEGRLIDGQEEAALPLDRQLTIRDLLALDPEEHPWVTRRWVVRGDPGAGKTTLLRHLAATLAAEPDRLWVPVFETLPRLMRKPEWLLDRLEREMRKAGAAVQGLAAALDREGQEGRLLLLLDGLDEVPRDDREDAEALLRQVSKRWPKTPLVVTSRTIGYRRPGSEFVELDLLPFDEEQRRKFLERWFGRASGKADKGTAARVMETLADDAGLRDLAGNPLYLTLIALLVERGQAPDRNRSGLYDQVFQLLLDGRHRPEKKGIDGQAGVRSLLRRLACDMTRDNHDAEPRAELEARLYTYEYDELRKPLEKVPAWRRSLSPFLDDVAEKTGILGPHDGPSADWRFWHRTFREALTAEQLAEDLDAGGERAIMEKAREVEGDEGRWAEPFALLVGRVDDPNALITSLAEANRGLGLRALATAQRLRDETLTGVLKLTVNWQDRRDVYRQIPELIDNPERALALVDRLRKRTRNGNDLYFLEETAAAVGDHWPDAERLARHLVSRLYDHIPTPHEKSFQWVKAPLDGRVELWRGIPAGEGWIGSPEGEGQVDEHPRHRVKFTRPFMMGAVPVTNAQYAAFDPDHTWREWDGVPRDEVTNHPVVNVSWYAATAFCRWLDCSGFAGARLAAEEEWEYACRAGSQTRYWSGDSEDDLAEVGWYSKNSAGRTHRVGEKLANAWGLYDVHGNVLEWTASSWRGYRFADREDGNTVDPAERVADLADDSDRARVVRGGGYQSAADEARAACRGSWVADSENEALGFRVLVPADPTRHG